MKILAIHGSPRTLRSITRQLAQFVLEGAAEAGAETEMIDLCDLKITPCTACEGCSFNGICVFEDDMPALVERMKEADGVVFASPVYIDNVSGQMKIFFDRLADAIHYQLLAGKFGCSVASTHTSGGDAVVAYQNHVLNYLAVVSVGGISVATGGDSYAVDAREADARALGKRLCAAIADGFSDPKQEAEIADNREFFRDIVVENKDMRTEEYERWAQLGWIP
ncbi:flavodoxin family protein [Methanoregula formicica]|uniref:Multimeric flavodoxin WrbA n=1 Tax=Methanoregula formicica (strain DSM 22288 / NBRC 105244 / SMSP) TaxID=593750 RepID=L0HDP8_METFS|nr:flavodoxin family protein [Methanoregula formicica]AGB01453.1 multimeric flavodoxin WrbA [Methanoregula formicica SMSP]